jgi:hypothetical protein
MNLGSHVTNNPQKLKQIAETQHCCHHVIGLSAEREMATRWCRPAAQFCTRTYLCAQTHLVFG